MATHAASRNAARAELLAGSSPAAEEPLRFVAGLCRAQADAETRFQELHVAGSLEGVLARDVERILPALMGIVRFAVLHAPTQLSAAAAARSNDDERTARSRLDLFWMGHRPSSEDYLSRAMLRPYLETLRALGIHPDRPRARARCPFCGGAPIVGCRRGGSASDGAARFLSCALCGLEWPIGRIVCPSCFESDPRKLPSFASPDHPLARIEACETCRRYVKSLDLSEDARPVPEIDDLTSLALDLWAMEAGFTRLEPGLAGL